MTPAGDDALVHWSNHSAQHLVRYEALFKLLEELQAADDVDRMATLAARQWKYFANVASFRLLLEADGSCVVIDGWRGQSRQTRAPRPDRWDAWHLALGRPHLWRPADGPHDPPPPEHLCSTGTAEIQTLHVERHGRPAGLLTVVARHVAFTDLDNKFIRLFANLFADRVSTVLAQQAAIEALALRATRDALTGIPNRGGIRERLASQLALARRTGQPLSVVMADIDFFKRVNDHHGHAAGDAVLCDLAQRLQGACRGGEAVGRHGGEEFLFVLFPCSAAEALLVAERYRRITAERPVVLGPVPARALDMTISLGCASTEGRPGIEEAELVALADAALYQAKQAGRNCVRGAPPPPVLPAPAAGP